MGLAELIRSLYGVGQPQGCTEEDIDRMKAVFGTLPAAVEDFYRLAGRTEELNQGQDTWLFPEHQKGLLLEKWSNHLILLNENQGCCQAGIRREDLALPDPPVYTSFIDKQHWELSAPTTTEFLAAALTYEAVFRYAYTQDDMFWFSEEDMTVIRASLAQRPAVLRNWFNFDVYCYSNRPDNLVAVLALKNGEYQALYGGATEESYAALLEVIGSLGEPL